VQPAALATLFFLVAAPVLAGGPASQAPAPAMAAAPAPAAAVAAPGVAAPAVAAPAAAPVAVSAPESAEGRPLGLRELQELARAADPRARIAAAQLEGARGKKTETDWIWFPSFTTQVGLGGPTGETRLSDKNDISSYTSGSMWGPNAGVQARGQIDAILPLYTFGKISSGQAAAGHAVDARAALLTQQQNGAAQDVAKAYWGYQTTRDAQKSIDELLGKLDEARKVAARLIAEESDQATASDLSRLELVGYEIQAQSEAAVAQQRLAEVALKLLVGRSPDEPLAVKREELPPPPDAPDLQALLKRAEASRPELKAAKANVQAREALVSLERAKYWPDLALAGGYSFAWTSNADTPLSPYANNPFNFNAGYVGIGLRGSFDIPQKMARLTQVEADLHEAQAMLVGAERLLRLDVEHALGDLASARGRARHYADSSAMAKRMLIKGALGIDSGLGNAADVLLDALLYARAEGERLKARFDGQMAWAALENAVGESIEPPARASNPQVQPAP
jgi:outer membrane protein TolC